MVQERQDSQAQSEEFANVYYVIDRVEAEAQGRALEALLMSRRCPSCQARIQEGVPIVSAREQMAEIAKCCATSDEFIRPGLSLKEIVFRLLLKEGNRPVALNTLHYALTEEWARPTNPMNISLQTLKRTLDEDTYYGFKEVSGEVKTKPKG